MRREGRDGVTIIPSTRTNDKADEKERSNIQSKHEGYNQRRFSRITEWVQSEIERRDGRRLYLVPECPIIERWKKKKQTKNTIPYDCKK